MRQASMTKLTNQSQLDESPRETKADSDLHAPNAPLPCRDVSRVIACLVGSKLLQVASEAYTIVLRFLSMCI